MSKPAQPGPLAQARHLVREQQAAAVGDVVGAPASIQERWAWTS